MRKVLKVFAIVRILLVHLADQHVTHQINLQGTADVLRSGDDCRANARRSELN